MTYLYYLQNKMWTVVLFKSDNTVAAVPNFWYCNGLCAWPKKFNTKLIQQRKKPNEIEFSNYKAKILFKDISIFNILPINLFCKI